MADDTDKKKPKRGKGKIHPFKVVRSEGPSARPSEDAIRQLYMASKFVEWSPFAKSLQWDPQTSRVHLPVAEWAAEKRQIIAREQAESIADAVFHHSGRWHHDVLRTLKDYPESNDAMHGIIKKRINDIIGVINRDQEQGVLAQQRGERYEPEFAKIKTSDLATLAATLKMVTEAKHKSLMINDWSFKVAETFSDPKQFQDEAHRVADQEWKVQIIGGENLTGREMQALLAKWYDPPLEGVVATDGGG